MNTAVNSPVRFGVFELDLRSGELRRSGHRIALQPQPLEILRALLERPGEVVTREELRRRLWRNGAYVDFDRSLNKAIVKLRDALGDDADSPRYIETLPRHGYRFLPLAQAQIPALTGESANEDTLQADPPPSPSPVPAAAAASDGTAVPAVRAQRPGSRSKWWWGAASLALLLTILIGAVVRHGWRNAGPTAAGHDVPASHMAAFAPPPNSIAVLPLVNLSTDREQDYFSDGVTEDLLDSLVRIDGLQVAGRTSAYYFKGKDVDVGTVAHRLNVATVLEGSVRRSAGAVRVTVHLTDAASGFTIWSATYDRSVGDILTLQSEMAHAIAAALKLKLLGDPEAELETGGTRNAAAFDAYLRASRAYWSGSGGANSVQTAIAGYTEAVRLDPSYALAYASRSIALENFGLYYADAAAPGWQRQAQADARRAVDLAPRLALAHLARAIAAGMSLDFDQDQRELELALSLAPGSERILRNYSNCAAERGQFDRALAAARRALALDPLNAQAHVNLAEVLYNAGRYRDAILATDHALAIEPQDWGAQVIRGYSYYALGALQQARAACSASPDNVVAQQCLAIVEHRLGRGEEARTQLARLRASAKDSGAYQYAAIYAQWGETAQALRWLEAALRMRSPWLGHLRTDPLLAPLRQSTRFRAIERALKLSD